MSRCLVDGCATPPVAKSYCHLHYNRWRRTGDPLSARRMCPRGSNVSERLDLVLDRSKGDSACWPFVGAVNHTGYGRMPIKGVTKGVHVWAFLQAGGELTPEKPFVLHSCDNRLCANPKHLRAGSLQDNMDDKVSRNRQSRMPGELNPLAKLTEVDVRGMRRKFELGQSSRRELSDEYGVTRAAVELIIAGKLWTHLLNHERREVVA